MKKVFYWAAPAALLLSLAAGVKAPATAEPTSSEAGNRSQIAQQVVQPSQIACRRVRPEALNGRLPIYSGIDMAGRSEPIGYVVPGDTVMLQNNMGMRGADGNTYVPINEPMMGYVQTNLSGIDTLGYCSDRAGVAIRGMW